MVIIIFAGQIERNGFLKQLFIVFLPDYPANSNDSYCSSDVSLDGSSFEQIDEGTSDTFHNLAGEMQRNSSANNNGSYPSPNLLTLSSGIINPIDKLYLMQDSYFSGE